MIGKISKNTDEAVFCRKPTKYSNVYCLEFPDRTFFDFDAPEFPPMSQKMSAQISVKEIVELFEWSRVGPTRRRLLLTRAPIKPSNKVLGAEEAPVWQFAWTEEGF